MINHLYSDALNLKMGLEYLQQETYLIYQKLFSPKIACSTFQCRTKKRFCGGKRKEWGKYFQQMLWMMGPEIVLNLKKNKRIK